MLALLPISSLFFFNDTATTEIYTLSLHDALPIWRADDRPAAISPAAGPLRPVRRCERVADPPRRELGYRDRKSTRLNYSHTVISYAVFCLKKKKKKTVNHYLAALNTRCNDDEFNL